jgi:hypothetical protein
LSVSTTRVTSRKPPAIRTSATRVFVMARSAFIVPKKRERWAGDIKAQELHSDFWPPVRHIPSSHRDRPRRPGVRLPSSSQTAHMPGDRGCQGEVAVPWRNSQRGNSIGPAPKPPNYWASIKPVAHLSEVSAMTTTRFPTLLVLSAILWLAASLGDKNCSITRPGGVKEPGVTNIRGECCSSFYSNSGNWNDCVPPTPDRPDGAKFDTSVSKD